MSVCDDETLIAGYAKAPLHTQQLTFHHHKHSSLLFVVSPKQNQMESFNFLGAGLNTLQVQQLRTWLMAQLA
jgi:hypothetical protein